MEKIEKILKREDTIPKRKFAKHLTTNIMIKADIPIDELERLKNSDKKSTADLAIMLKIMNAALIEGPPITGDEPESEMREAYEEFNRFLVNSRSKSTSEKLKEKRLSKR